MTLDQQLKTIVSELYPDYSGPIELSLNHNISLGDFASPVAFAIAKQTGGNAAQIADTVAQKLNSDSIAATVSTGAPFINFTLSAEAWAELHDLVRLEMGPNPRSLISGKKVNVEFISANPTGPLTLANARGGYAGDALANILKFAGAEVEREYYYNDSGNQIMELGRSIVAARDEIEIEGGYKGGYVQELAQKIDESDPYAAGMKGADYIFTNWIKPMVDRMGIEFDNYKSEQSLIDDGIVDQVIALLKERELIYEKDGALWLKVKQFSNTEEDRVLKRSDKDGTYTYLLKDIAYHYDKIRRSYTDLITIVGADHFTEMKALELIVNQILAPSTEWKGEFHLSIIQFVRLIENGQEVKMSKRAGTYITIDDLLDQINSDVARFFFLMRDINSSMDFDLSIARETSDKNPVYYVQYAYVRAKHILEKADNTPNELSNASLNEDERKILLQISQFSTVIANIVKSHEVHKLTYFTIELAKLFHSFYSKYPVLKSESDEKQNRLVITHLTFETLKTALSLLGISQPDRMVATEVIDSTE
jgi:arginyl-tRNA synthetase